MRSVERKRFAGIVGELGYDPSKLELTEGDLPDASVYTASQAIEQNQLDITTLQNNVSALQNNVSDLQNNVSALQSGVLAVEQDILENYRKLGTREVTVRADGSGDYTTFQDALASITTASSSTRYVITCYDNASYAMPATLATKAYVDIYAPYVTWTFTGGATVELNSDCNILIGNVTRTDGGDSAFLNNSGSGKGSLTILETARDEGTGIFIRDTNAGGLMYYNIRTMEVAGGGTFYGGFATGADHAHITLGDLYLSSNNAKGIHRSSGTGSIVANIDHIVDTGFSGTIALDVDTGNINLVCNNISAETVYDVESGATLSLNCVNLGGSQLNDGTVIKTITSSELDDTPADDSETAVTSKWVYDNLTNSGTIKAIPDLQFETKSTDFTAAAGKIYYITTGTNRIEVDYPTSPSANDEIWFIKADSSSGVIEFALSINGYPFFEIEKQYCGIKIKYTGSEWVIVGTIGECEVRTISNTGSAGSAPTISSTSLEMVYQHYQIGTLDNDDSTNLVSYSTLGTTQDKILSAMVIPHDATDDLYRVQELWRGESSTVAFFVSLYSTYIGISGVGSRLQGHAYRLKVDYYI